MNAAESKALKKGSRVYWRKNAGDSGHVTDQKFAAPPGCEVLGGAG
jgi:hypothetical protein